MYTTKSRARIDTRAHAHYLAVIKCNTRFRDIIIAAFKGAIKGPDVQIINLGPVVQS